MSEENKISWFSKKLLGTVARVEAFLNPEERGQSVSFNKWADFSNWMTDGNKNDAEETVTTTSGTKISTVWNCLNVLAQDIASLPFQVRQETDEGRVVVRNNIHRLINKRPNRNENAWQFWYGMVYIGEAWGNSYAYIVRDGNGSPVELIRLKPWEVTLELVDGDLFYIVNGATNPIHSRDIFHYKSFVLDGLEGVSKITYNANLIGLKQKQNKFAARSTGNKPPGYLYSPDAKQEQRNEAKKSWDANVKGDQIGGTAVMWGTWEYKQLMIDPQAAAIVELTEWTDTNTYGCFRIQPVMVSNHKNSNYSNAEQQNIHHAKFTLAPIITNLEQEANEKLFSERNKVSSEPYYCKFNMKNLLRGDTAAQTAYLTAATTSGVINSDEWREWDDMPPQKDEDGKIGIGKKYYIQGAMVEKGKDVDSAQTENLRMKNTLEELLKGVN